MVRNIKDLIENMDNVLNSINRLKNEYSDRKQELFKNSSSDAVLDILEEIVKLKHWEQSILSLKQEMLETGPIAVDDSKDQPHSTINLFNRKYTFTSYNELLIIVAENLVSKKPYEIIKLPEDTKLNNSGIRFSYTKDDIKNKPYKLTNGMYIETDYDSKNIIDICNSMLMVCGFSDQI